jgi:hypothetical protein
MSWLEDVRSRAKSVPAPLENRAPGPHIPTSIKKWASRPANLPRLGKVVTPSGGCGRSATKGAPMITRRHFLLRSGGALVCAPAIVRGESLMTLRGVLMPAARVHYGFVDRLRIDSRYRAGELRGPGLVRVIEDGVLRHIALQKLACDIARWGLDPLPPAARRERVDFFGWRPANLPTPGPRLQPHDAEPANADA